MCISSWWVPRAVTMPSCEEEDAVGLVEQQRARGHDGGGAPAPRAAARRPAMRASVCASTALVGSTRTSVSAPGEQRAGQREALPLAAGEGAAALLDLAVEAVGAAPRGRPRRWRRRACAGSWRRRSGPTGRARRAAVPVKSRGSVSLTTIRRRTVVEREVERAESGRGGRRPRPAPNRPSRSASAAASSGRADTTAVSRPGSTTTPLRSSTSGTPGAGSAACRDAVRVVAVVGLHARGPGSASGRRCGPG